MTTITLYTIYHKNQRQIAVKFPYSLEIRDFIKSLHNVKWSKTHNTFYILENSTNKRFLFDMFRQKNWYVDYSALKKEKDPTLNKNIQLPSLTEQQKTNLTKYKRWLQQKRLSFNTVNTYVEVTAFFIRYTNLKNTQSYTSRLIESFNYEFIVKPNKSISYQNQCINGIKKYLEFMGLDVETLHLKRPQKDKKLPVVLSLAEIKQIFEATQNLKHKTLLSLIYSAGLRIGEAINLKISDIDSKRMLIHIRGAKGKKDRYTLLSESFLNLLRLYYKTYKPKVYLFEGRNLKQYTSSSARKILNTAIVKAGLKKHITLHTLRHSFATHLLENGTDIRYIQELLGHNSPKTTMIYTHVTQASIKKIKNPFDSL